MGNDYGQNYYGEGFNPWVDHHWVENRIHDRYNNTPGGSADQNQPIQNLKVGTDVAFDNTLSKTIAMHSVVGAANNALWGGETMMLTNAYGGDDQYAGCADEGGDSLMGFWGRKHVIESRMFIDIADVPSADMLSGVGLGVNVSQGGANASGAKIAASPTNPMVLVYAQWDVPKWVLLLCKGGAAKATVDLTGVTAPIVPGAGGIGGSVDRIRILYDPINKRVSASINGKYGGAITDATKFPDPVGLTPVGFNAFIQSGTGVGAKISSAFYHCHYWTWLP